MRHALPMCLVLVLLTVFACERRSKADETTSKQDTSILETREARLEQSLASNDSTAKSNKPVARWLLPQYGARPVEQFGVVLLDTKNRLLKVSIVSVGSLDATVVLPRDVFREAALKGAAALVLFHNHPSGDPTPSGDDIAITKRLEAAGQVMGIAVLDHVVLGDAGYFSFKEHHRL